MCNACNSARIPQTPTEQCTKQYLAQVYVTRRIEFIHVQFHLKTFLGFFTFVWEISPFFPQNFILFVIVLYCSFNKIKFEKFYSVCSNFFRYLNLVLNQPLSSIIFVFHLEMAHYYEVVCDLFKLYFLLCFFFLFAFMYHIFVYIFFTIIGRSVPKIKWSWN